MSRLILGFSSLEAFSPDSRPRILTNLLLIVLTSVPTRLVATTIEDSSDYDISNSEHRDRTKRTADNTKLLELEDFLGGF